jgi:DMSO/TMAO reductase YedYZ molybdopterin-dependent catalytic subunit
MKRCPFAFGSVMPAFAQIVLASLLCMSACEHYTREKEDPEGPEAVEIFPGFINPNDGYIDTRIGLIPSIHGENYRLSISGAVRTPGVFSLDDLRGLDQVKMTLTTECIGNPGNGDLVGTAEWRGFRLFDLLETLGISDSAFTVKYTSADGYFTYNTLEEVEHGNVLGALYMNDEPLPERYGFPLRIIFPGYYGVRHPGWITAIEVLGSGPEDFWSGSGWKTDSAMSIDSKIFFPVSHSRYTLGDTVRIGGSAYGSRRISSVDVTLDNGESWMPATIRQSLDLDHVWVFWEAQFVPGSAGSYTLRSRATALDGRVQPKLDNTPLDGTSSWPSVTIEVGSEK